MNSVFTYLDTAPILDLAYLSIFLIAIAVLIGWAIHTYVSERRYAKKRQRLIELAGGEPPSVRSGRKPLSKTAAASTDSPYPGAASSPQGSFDADHGFNNTPRPRVGTRRGK